MNLKKYILTITSFCSITLFAQLNPISGPTEVCPTGAGYVEYTYTATSTVKGCFKWFVFEDGQTPGGSISCICGTSASKSSSFTYAFNANLGSALVRVFWVQKDNIFCATKIRDFNVTKRVFKPGVPFNAVGGGLSFCPGETKTISIPGVPGVPNTDENCHWHHKWVWNVPSGWLVEGQAGSKTTARTSVQITAPSNAALGEVTNRKIVVNSEPQWPYFVRDEGIPWVGKPKNVTGSMSGPTTVYKSNLYIYRVTDQNHKSGSFYWTVPRGFSITAGGNGYNYIQVSVGSRAGSGYVQVWRTNSCGNGGARYKYVTVSSGGGGGGPIELILSPNPASNEVSIDFTNIETLEAYLDNLEIKNKPLQIEITDIYEGKTLHRGVVNKDGLKLNLQNVKCGIYIVRVFNKEFSSDVRLVVE